MNYELIGPLLLFVFIYILISSKKTNEKKKGGEK